eukprot:419712_1
MMMQEYLNKITNENNIEFWLLSLVLSPLFVLCLILLHRKCDKHVDKKIKKNTISMSLLHKEKEMDHFDLCLPRPIQKNAINDPVDIDEVVSDIKIELSDDEKQYIQMHQNDEEENKYENDDMKKQINEEVDIKDSGSDIKSLLSSDINADMNKDCDIKTNHIPVQNVSANIILFVHFVLLLLWIFWHLFTFQTLTISINIEGDDTFIPTDSRRNRFKPLESFAILWTVTTVIKVACKIFIDVRLRRSPKNQFKLKLGVHIFIEMLYSLGIKFVFSNIKEWKIFIIISAMSCIANITFYGMFLSHIFAKNLIIKTKEIINQRYQKIAQKRLFYIHDINDRCYWNRYNKELAIYLGSSFVISVYSSFIIIVYLFMFGLVFGVNVNDEVYQFLGIDCLFGIVVFCGQLFLFQSEDVKYFVEIWRLSFKKDSKKNSIKDLLEVELKTRSNSMSNYSSILSQSHNDTKSNFDIGEIIFYQMLLSWIWMGTLTGIPSDLFQP